MYVILFGSQFRDTALIVAARTGHVAVAELLLQRGAMLGALGQVAPFN